MLAKRLCISVTFLQPTFHGRLGKEDHAPNEWPPSPLRLFQAMVAGAAARWGARSDEGGAGAGRERLTDPEAIAAFRWLERITEAAPPVILAPGHEVGAPVPVYVPNNSADLVAARWARGDTRATFDDRTRKIVRPTHLIGGDAVHFLWALTGPDVAPALLDRHLPTITAAARSIVALGWGIDAAIGDARLIDDGAAPGANDAALECWTPATGLPRSTLPALRLPRQGTIDELINRHEAFLGRLEGGVFRAVPPLRVFTQAVYSRGPAPLDRPFAAFTLRPVIDPATAEQDTPEGAAERRKADQFRAFPAHNAAKVAAMLRHAACEAAKQPGLWPFTEEDSSRYVAGHGDGGKRRAVGDNSPRFSYLAVPSIGHTHADGMIRRVIVAEPFGGEGEHAAWAERTLAGLSLVDEDTRRPVATIERLDRSDGAERKMLARFVGPSREWVTATPIVLPGFDDLKTDKAVTLLSRACDQAGLPAGSVDGFEFIGPPARADDRYFVPAYLRGLPLRHVVVRFKHDARGPIAIGAGRHCGLGILAVGSTL
ncbi:MAG: type I-U CRISPR-associated protein Cas5/Cas6 [Phycisphaerales bacterium]|nr:type I-U CRISPR-associated protein Cas5/Cas6 [Phycisphaerales bacterium]